jgi:hypothetical protein
VINESPGFDARRRLVLFLYWIAGISCRFSVVGVEQSTEPLSPDDRAFGGVVVGWLDDRSAEALVRPVFMIMGDVLSKELPKVGLRPSG